MSNKAKIAALNLEINGLHQRANKLEEEVLQLMLEDVKAEIRAFGETLGISLEYGMEITCTNEIWKYATNRRTRGGFYPHSKAKLIAAYNGRIRLSWGDDSTGWEDIFPPEMIMASLREHGQIKDES